MYKIKSSMIKEKIQRGFFLININGGHLSGSVTTTSPPPKIPLSNQILQNPTTKSRPFICAVIFKFSMVEIYPKSITPISCENHTDLSFSTASGLLRVPIVHRCLHCGPARAFLRRRRVMVAMAGGGR